MNKKAKLIHCFLVFFLLIAGGWIGYAFGYKNACNKYSAYNCSDKFLDGCLYVLKIELKNHVKLLELIKKREPKNEYLNGIIKAYEVITYNLQNNIIKLLELKNMESEVND